jgi:hypothetical protein
MLGQFHLVSIRKDKIMNNQFKVGDKVRFRAGDSICTPNYPVIPMKVSSVNPQPDGTTQVEYEQAWYYNGFGGTTDSRWLELAPVTQ